MTPLQQVVLNIFNEVSELCDKNGIPYFAIGGTCLGAVRHKGFIPWDDDMDIAIPIEFFDRFLSLAATELPDHLELIAQKDMPHRCGVIHRIADKRTTCIMETAKDYPDEYSGIFLDVMPLAGIPSSEKKRWIYKLYYNSLYKLDFMRKRPVRDIPSFAGKCCWVILRAFSFCIPRSLFYSLWMKLLRRYPVSSSDYVGYVWTARLFKNDLFFKQDDFNDHVDLPFEDRTIRCPVGWDDFLTVFFGDYMKLPPEDQRKGHENFVYVATDIPYSVYNIQKNHPPQNTKE